MAICKVDHCTRKILAKGLCAKHYQWNAKYGDPEFQKEKKKCSVSGCESKYYAKGFCKYHYDNNHTHGDPEYKRNNHGLSTTPTYNTWSGMIKRCYCPKTHGYHRYGGRGIVVCDNWKRDFLCFLSDMGKRPFLNAQIDRIDNDGNYEPKNCRWVLPAENARNQSRNKLTMAAANEIRKMYAAGDKSQRQISEIFRISQSMVSLIVANKEWFLCQATPSGG